MLRCCILIQIFMFVLGSLATHCCGQEQVVIRVNDRLVVNVYVPNVPLDRQLQTVSSPPSASFQPQPFDVTFSEGNALPKGNGGDASGELNPSVSESVAGKPVAKQVTQGRNPGADRPSALDFRDPIPPPAPSVRPGQSFEAQILPQSTDQGEPQQQEDSTPVNGTTNAQDQEVSPDGGSDIQSSPIVGEEGGGGVSQVHAATGTEDIDAGSGLMPPPLMAPFLGSQGGGGRPLAHVVPHNAVLESGKGNQSPELSPLPAPSTGPVPSKEQSSFGSNAESKTTPSATKPNPRVSSIPEPSPGSLGKGNSGVMVPVAGATLLPSATFSQASNAPSPTDSAQFSNDTPAEEGSSGGLTVMVAPLLTSNSKASAKPSLTTPTTEETAGGKQVPTDTAPSPSNAIPLPFNSKNPTTPEPSQKAAGGGVGNINKPNQAQEEATSANGTAGITITVGNETPESSTVSLPSPSAVATTQRPVEQDLTTSNADKPGGLVVTVGDEPLTSAEASMMPSSSSSTVPEPLATPSPPPAELEVQGEETPSIETNDTSGGVFVMGHVGSSGEAPSTEEETKKPAASSGLSINPHSLTQSGELSSAISPVVVAGGTSESTDAVAIPFPSFLPASAGPSSTPSPALSPSISPTPSASISVSPSPSQSELAGDTAIGADDNGSEASPEPTEETGVAGSAASEGVGGSGVEGRKSAQSNAFAIAMGIVGSLLSVLLCIFLVGAVLRGRRGGPLSSPPSSKYDNQRRPVGKAARLNGPEEMKIVDDPFDDQGSYGGSARRTQGMPVAASDFTGPSQGGDVAGGDVANVTSGVIPAPVPTSFGGFEEGRERRSRSGSKSEGELSWLDDETPREGVRIPTSESYAFAEDAANSGDLLGGHDSSMKKAAAVTAGAGGAALLGAGLVKGLRSRREEHRMQGEEVDDIPYSGSVSEEYGEANIGDEASYADETVSNGGGRYGPSEPGHSSLKEATAATAAGIGGAALLGAGLKNSVQNGEEIVEGGENEEVGVTDEHYRPNVIGDEEYPAYENSITTVESDGELDKELENVPEAAHYYPEAPEYVEMENPEQHYNASSPTIEVEESRATQNASPGADGRLGPLTTGVAGGSVAGGAVAVNTAARLAALNADLRAKIDEANASTTNITRPQSYGTEEEQSSRGTSIHSRPEDVGVKHAGDDKPLELTGDEALFASADAVTFEPYHSQSRTSNTSADTESDTFDIPAPVGISGVQETDLDLQDGMQGQSRMEITPAQDRQLGSRQSLSPGNDQTSPSTSVNLSQEKWKQYYCQGHTGETDEDVESKPWPHWWATRRQGLRSTAMSSLISGENGNTAGSEIGASGSEGVGSGDENNSGGSSGRIVSSVPRSMEESKEEEERARQRLEAKGIESGTQGSALPWFWKERVEKSQLQREDNDFR